MTSLLGGFYFCLLMLIHPETGCESTGKFHCHSCPYGLSSGHTKSTDNDGLSTVEQHIPNSVRPQTRQVVDKYKRTVKTLPFDQ